MLHPHSATCRVTMQLTAANITIISVITKFSVRFLLFSPTFCRLLCQKCPYSSRNGFYQLALPTYIAPQSRLWQLYVKSYLNRSAIVSWQWMSSCDSSAVSSPCNVAISFSRPIIIKLDNYCLIVSANIQKKIPDNPWKCTKN